MSDKLSVIKIVRNSMDNGDMSLSDLKWLTDKLSVFHDNKLREKIEAIDREQVVDYMYAIGYSMANIERDHTEWSKGVRWVTVPTKKRLFGYPSLLRDAFMEIARLEDLSISYIVDSILSTKLDDEAGSE